MLEDIIKHINKENTPDSFLFTSRAMYKFRETFSGLLPIVANTIFALMSVYLV